MCESYATQKPEARDPGRGKRDSMAAFSFIPSSAMLAIPSTYSSQQRSPLPFGKHSDKHPNIFNLFHWVHICVGVLKRGRGFGGFW